MLAHSECRVLSACSIYCNPIRESLLQDLAIAGGGFLHDVFQLQYLLRVIQSDWFGSLSSPNRMNSIAYNKLFVNDFLYLKQIIFKC